MLPRIWILRPGNHCVPKFPAPLNIRSTSKSHVESQNHCRTEGGRLFPQI